jgi:hypothetical protein
MLCACESNVKYAEKSHGQDPSKEYDCILAGSVEYTGATVVVVVVGATVVVVVVGATVVVVVVGATVVVVVVAGSPLGHGLGPLSTNTSPDIAPQPPASQ